MDSPFKSLRLVAVFWVVGIVSALGMARIAKSFWSREPPAQQQGCQAAANEQQNNQATGDPDVNFATGSMGEETGGPTLHPEAIERLKASLDELGQLLQTKKDLESKVAHLDHLLEEKKRALSRAHEAETGNIHELETKVTIQEEKIKRLQAMLEKQDQLLQERTAKLFSLEYAAEQQNAEKEEKIARLESEVALLNRMLAENTTALSSAEEAASNRDQLARNLLAANQRQREEIRQMKMAPRSNTDNEQINDFPPTIVNNADSIESVTEVTDLIKTLNAQIEQGSSLITDSLFSQEFPSAGKELEIVWDELNDIIGPWLCNNLKRRLKELVEPDPLITQITLQTGLVNACGRIVNGSDPPFWIDDLIFSRTISSIEKTSGQAAADAWGVLLRGHMSVWQSERQRANKEHLTDVLLKLITAVGGPLENGILPPQYSEVLKDILKGSFNLYKIVSEGLVPKMEVVTDIIPCDTEFDPSQMADTEGNQSETGSSRVVCTVEMGLRCRKRDELRKKCEEWDVTMKPKVVLTTTLEPYA